MESGIAPALRDGNTRTPVTLVRDPASSSPIPRVAASATRAPGVADRAVHLVSEPDRSAPGAIRALATRRQNWDLLQLPPRSCVGAIHASPHTLRRARESPRFHSVHIRHRERNPLAFPPLGQNAWALRQGLRVGSLAVQRIPPFLHCPGNHERAEWNLHLVAI